MDAADDGCCRGLRPVDICARKRSKRSVTGGSGEGPTISPPVSPVGGAHETTLLKLPFQLGDTVEANWRLRGAYYMGVVTATNQDGTYSIKYVDGDSEERVLGGNIRKLQTRRRAVVAASERASRQTKQVIPVTVPHYPHASSACARMTTSVVLCSVRVAPRHRARLARNGRSIIFVLQALLLPRMLLQLIPFR